MISTCRIRFTCLAADGPAVANEQIVPMAQITESAKRGLPTPAVGPASAGHGYDVRRERAAWPEREGGTSAAGPCTGVAGVILRGRRSRCSGCGAARQIGRAAPDLLNRSADSTSAARPGAFTESAVRQTRIRISKRHDDHGTASEIPTELGTASPGETQ